MSDIESVWHRHPGYRIDLLPCPSRGRVRHGDRVLAESDRCLLVKESDHPDQLYFPFDDVHWTELTETDHHTTCPFKGEADYWSVAAADHALDDVAWTYRRPFPEVAGLEGHVAFYPDRLRVELIEQWPADGHTVTHRFPVWGDIADLVRLLDLRPSGDDGFVSPPYPDPPMGTFLEIPSQRRPRLVVEGGHLLAQGISAAAKSVPGQRVVSASMIFSKAALFDAPLEIRADVLRGGRTYSTVETRTTQHGNLCSVGLVLLDAGADDVYRGGAAMPDVPGPAECPHHDFSVTGRDVRVVDGAYDNDPERTGPAELFAWIRLRDRPDDAALHAALVAQPTTHWTIAASMRPHVGITEAMAHVTLSTGPMTVDIAFHDEPDVSEWLLYENPAIYAGRGHVQGQGRVFSEAGGLVASYSVHAMVRALTVDPDRVGGSASAM